jgi:flagellar basal-body rod modification protein FlgD
MTDAVGGAAATAYTPATTTVERKDQGSQKDMFLKLLVAQMKYQDPSNPASSSELMAQTATLAQVQSLDAIAKQNSQSLTLQKSLSAGALVGQTVSYTDSDGATKTGVVTAVKISSDSTAESQAVIGGVDVDLARISQVTLPTATAGTSATS